MSQPELSLKQRIALIDDGRFEGLVNACDVKDVCEQCNYFNKSIDDYRQGYRCHTMPSCIDATLNPLLITYINKKLGLI